LSPSASAAAFLPARPPRLSEPDAALNDASLRALPRPGRPGSTGGRGLREPRSLIKALRARTIAEGMQVLKIGRILHQKSNESSGENAVRRGNEDEPALSAIERFIRQMVGV
jgi:hypothetical protein